MVIFFKTNLSLELWRLIHDLGVPRVDGSHSRPNRVEEEIQSKDEVALCTSFQTLVLELVQPFFLWCDLQWNL